MAGIATTSSEIEVTDPSAVLPRLRRAARYTARPHWWVHVPFAILIVVGAIPRVVAVFGYQPGLMFFGDSFAYLLGAQDGEPRTARPYGYSAFLRVIAWTGDLALVAVVQHLAMLALAVVVYVWLLRRGAPVWLAAIVPLPFVVDGYQILTEHALLTETLFVCLIMAAALLVMRHPLRWPVAAAAGALIAGASLTRTVALPLIALLVAYLCLRRVGWRPVVACVVAFSIPVVTYAAWYSSFGSNDFALQSDGRFLYARVAPFADCARMATTDQTVRLCDPTIPGTRPSPNFYAWDSQSPLATADFPPGVDRQEVARAFAVEAIRSQPDQYVRTVIGDTVQHFGVGRSYGRLDTPPSWWNFPEVPAAPGQQLALSGSGFRNDQVDVVLDDRAAGFLREWQRLLGTQGPILFAGLILAILGAWRGRSSSGTGVRRLDALLLAGIGLGLLVLSSATSVFDYRYGIPAAPFLYVAGGVGVLLLRQRRTTAAANAPAIGPALRSPTTPGHAADPTWTKRLPPGSSIALATVLVVGLVWFAPIQEYPIYGKFVASGAERGVLGYPTSNEQPMTSGPPGWRERDFDGGTIFSSVKPFTYVVLGPAAQSYRSPGLRRLLGPPSSGTVALRSSGAQPTTWFRRGALVQAAESDLIEVRPPLLAAWCEPRKACDLGAPLADAQAPSAGVLIQQFERGVLVKRPGGKVERLLTPIAAGTS